MDRHTSPKRGFHFQICGDSRTQSACLCRSRRDVIPVLDSDANWQRKISACPSPTTPSIFEACRQGSASAFDPKPSCRSPWSTPQDLPFEAPATVPKWVGFGSPAFALAPKGNVGWGGPADRMRVNWTRQTDRGTDQRASSRRTNLSARPASRSRFKPSRRSRYTLMSRPTSPPGMRNGSMVIAPV